MGNSLSAMLGDEKTCGPKQTGFKKERLKSKKKAA
jgi:hypothetical protein